MSYRSSNHQVSDNQLGQSPKIPRPTSSGQVLDHIGRSGARLEVSSQHAHSHSQPPPYYQHFPGHFNQQGSPHFYYGSYPIYSAPTQNIPQPYYANSYYGFSKARYPQDNHGGVSTLDSTSCFPQDVSKLPGPTAGTNGKDQGASTFDCQGDLEHKGHETKKEPELILSQEEASPVVIPGTSITLASEEDIRKWREERRRMWLVKISNNREKHKTELGIEDSNTSKVNAFHNVRKDKQFIQSIQNQVNRYNPNPNLSLKLIQRTMAEQNSNLLNFIEELGDAKLLEYELTEEEKEKLFGTGNKQGKAVKSYHHNVNNHINNGINKRNAYSRDGSSRYEGSFKRQQTSRHDT
ncbi:LADA_0G02454g1_1 [Lachancea dasiensis]|uniref:LADA_0G02454g1_1 n=1 Tax=Lachancea dasiensis TaxID=1072105 RepID=A0A1G4JR78_9SACH|nr:LADA_0G02454g1_1 [Lachancea dasiensis]